MERLLTYEEYQNGIGIALPQLSDDETAGGAEQKFDKWLFYTQIQLDFVLGEKLSGIDFNPEKIKKPYLKSIKNILAVRLNRAFHNDQILPNNVNVNYQQSGGISVAIASDILNEGWDFGSANERKMIEVSLLQGRPQICWDSRPTEPENGISACEKLLNCDRQIASVNSGILKSNDLDINYDGVVTINFKLKNKFIKEDLSNLRTAYQEDDEATGFTGPGYSLRVAENNVGKISLALLRRTKVPLVYDGTDLGENDNKYIPNLGQIKKLIEAGQGGDYIKTDLSNFRVNSVRSETTQGNAYQLDVKDGALRFRRAHLIPFESDTDATKDNQLPNLKQVNDLIAKSGGSLKCVDLNKCVNTILEILPLAYHDNYEDIGHVYPGYSLGIGPNNVGVKSLLLERRVYVPLSYQGEDLKDGDEEYIPNFGQIKRMIADAGGGGHFTKEQADNIKNTVLYLPDATPANNKPFIIADDTGYAMEDVILDDVFVHFNEIYEKFNLEIVGTIERNNYVEPYRGRVDNSIIEIQFLNKVREKHEWGDGNNVLPNQSQLVEDAEKNGGVRIGNLKKAPGSYQRITFNIIKGVGLKTGDGPTHMILKSEDKESENGKK